MAAKVIVCAGATLPEGRKLRVAVIGGGPAGASAADALAQEGIETYLIERKMDNCMPCGGAIPLCMIDEFGLPKDIVDRQVKKMAMISLTNKEVQIGQTLKHDEFIGMVRREVLDDFLRQRAKKNGATLINGLLWASNARKGEKKVLEVDVVIGADGVNSRVAKDIWMLLSLLGDVGLSMIKRRTSLGKELGAATIVDPLLPWSGRVAATGASRTSNGPLVPFLLRASDLELNFHGAEFLAIGKTMCGKAGGPDGWTQLLSEAAWAWHDFGVPLSLLCVAYRIGAKAMLSQVTTWAEEWLGHQASGGVPRRSLKDVVQQILVANEDGQAVVAEDLSKFFDSVDHRDLGLALVRLGAPRQFREFVLGFYGEHYKLFSAGGMLGDRWHSTSRGLCQGCPLSPLLASTLLMAWALRLERCPGVRAASFVDDRFLVLTADADATAARRESMAFDAALGFTCDVSKSKVASSSACAWAADLSHVFGYEWVKSFKVLGLLIDFDCVGQVTLANFSVDEEAQKLRRRAFPCGLDKAVPLALEETVPLNVACRRWPAVLGFAVEVLRELDWQTEDGGREITRIGTAAGPFFNAAVGTSVITALRRSWLPPATLCTFQGHKKLHDDGDLYLRQLCLGYGCSTWDKKARHKLELLPVCPCDVEEPSRRSLLIGWASDCWLVLCQNFSGCCPPRHRWFHAVAASAGVIEHGPSFAIGVDGEDQSSYTAELEAFLLLLRVGRAGYFILAMDCKGVLDTWRGGGRLPFFAQSFRTLAVQLQAKGTHLELVWVPSHGKPVPSSWTPCRRCSLDRLRAINARADKAAGRLARRRAAGSLRQRCLSERREAERWERKVLSGCDHVAVGTGTVVDKKGIQRYQQDIRDRAAVCIDGGEIIRVEAHPIPEHPRPWRVKDRAILVEDAAGYVTKCSGDDRQEYVQKVTFDSYLYKTVQGNASRLSFDPVGDLKLGWKTLTSLYKYNNQKTPEDGIACWRGSGSTHNSAVLAIDLSAMGENAGKFALMGCGLVCLGLLIFVIVMLASITVVNDRQQILYIFPTTKEVKNGPFTEIIWPHITREVRDAVQVSTSDFAVLKHERTQELRHVPGPEFVFMGAYESLEAIRSKTVLQKQEYIRLVDKMTGEERVVEGATTLVPRPLEDAPAGVETAIVIGAQNAVLVYNKTSGIRSLIRQAGAFVPAPYEEILSEQQAVLLEPLQYAVVKDLLTGEARNEVGPQLLQAGAYESILETKRKLVLEKDEYIQFLDKKTGMERVLRGPDQVVPEPNEEAEDGVQKAVFLTDQQAVVVLNRTSGQRRLETTNGVFFPEAYEKVLEVRTKYVVLTNQAAVTRDVLGALTMISGASGSTAFFLQPYEELVEMQWSVYDSPDAQDPVPTTTVSMIDLRAQKMFFNVEVRTSDNVKMRLEGTIFWQVQDVLTMIATTADPAGDVSQRARSGLVSAVSQNTFAVFMSQFNNITAQAYAQQVADGFYSSRGVELQSMEMTRYDMVDQESIRIEIRRRHQWLIQNVKLPVNWPEETADILQLIIQESTNRINRLQQQESENDVLAAKLVADIQLEQQRTDFIRTQASNQRLAALLEGQAQGTELVESAAAFIDGLNETVPDVADRTELYRMHQLLDARNADTHNLASGQAQLFLTPSNLNLQLRMANDEL
ncbi:chlP [Symbiodinium necroappetens]|uniref:ChlP protein n=1 Tax=Symbiodinium necroappetens TaxID=1628268 RepID=A0A812QY26_9DINO|nr:chlP [Symbiodinium necroappetens]